MYAEPDSMRMSIGRHLGRLIRCNLDSTNSHAEYHMGRNKPPHTLERPKRHTLTDGKPGVSDG